ncbi:MAG: hypothetical protein OEY33_02160, partial [Bdellovibrionales bacterium]|nr:hypothetical protein [Bdellovibrionales bacterium]
MIFKTLLIFVFSFTAFADMGQNLPYQIEDSPLEELKAEMEGVDGFIPEMGQEEEQEILKSKK